MQVDVWCTASHSLVDIERSFLQTQDTTVHYKTVEVYYMYVHVSALLEIRTEGVSGPVTQLSCKQNYPDSSFPVFQFL